MNFIFIIFIITAPIFWLYGIVCFLRSLTQKKSQQENNSLQKSLISTPLLAEIVSDLEEIRKKNKTVAQTLSKYKSRLSLRQAQESAPIVTDLPTSIAEFNSKSSSIPSQTAPISVAAPKAPEKS